MPFSGLSPVAELGGDIEVAGDTRIALEIVATHQRRIIARSAGRQGDPPDLGKIDLRAGRQARPSAGHVDEGAEGVGDDFRLLEHLLLHEVAVVALVDIEALAHRLTHRAVDRPVFGVEDFGTVVAEDDPVAVIQVTHGIRKGRQGDSIGAEEHFALAGTDGKRAAAPCADHEVFLALEQESQGECAFQPGQDAGNGVARRSTVLQFARHHHGDDLGVGLAFEGEAVGNQLVLELAEILDDAVMDNAHRPGCVRMRICFRSRPMRGPARMADADRSRQGLFAKPPLQIAQLALGTTTIQPTAIQRRDAGRVVSAIFETLQRVDEAPGHGLVADDANDAAHGDSSRNRRGTF